jgi:hypothetical protein
MSYELLDFNTVKQYLPFIEHFNVSKKAREDNGYLHKLLSSNGSNISDLVYQTKIKTYGDARKSFIARTLKQYINKPTHRRFLSLIAWQYMPINKSFTPDELSLLLPKNKSKIPRRNISKGKSARPVAPSSSTSVEEQNIPIKPYSPSTELQTNTPPISPPLKKKSGTILDLSILPKTTLNFLYRLNDEYLADLLDKIAKKNKNDRTNSEKSLLNKFFDVPGEEYNSNMRLLEQGAISLLNDYFNERDIKKIIKGFKSGDLIR